MRASEDTSDGRSQPPKPATSTVILLLGTIADTTWRMFVPIVGLLLLGLWIDKTFDTLPWGLLVLTVLGILIAGKLIERQLKNVKK